MKKAGQFGRADIVDRLFLRFSNSLFLDTRPAGRTITYAVMIVAGFAALLAASPNVWISDYFYDIFIPLDGAWRAWNGQMPHRDFYTPIGDLYYLGLACAAKLAGMQPKLVIWNNLLMVPFAVLATLQATRNRLPVSLRALLVITIGLLTMSPRSVDTLNNISFLASYNRHSWALMIPLMILTLVPDPTPRRHWKSDAVTIALLVLALCYLKATFGLASVPLLCISMLFSETRKTAITAALLIAASLALFTLISPINHGYINDLQRASKVAVAVQQMGNDTVLGILKVQSDLAASWFELFAPLAFAFWIGRSSHNETERRAGDYVLLRSLAACAGSLGLAWQNHDHSVPTQIAAMVIPVAALWRRYHERQEQSAPAPNSIAIQPFEQPAGRISLTLAAVILVLIGGIHVAEDGWAVTNHFIRTAFSSGQPVATLSPTLSQIRLVAGPPSTLLDDIIAGNVAASRYEHEISMSWPNGTAVIFDDAWRLFKAHEPKSPRIATLYFSSIMSYMTLTPPPRHLAAWLDAARTVGPGAPMDPETTLDDTNVVMIPKIFDHKIFLDMIEPYLKKNFSMVGETPLWEMWVRQSELTQNGS